MIKYFFVFVICILSVSFVLAQPAKQNQAAVYFQKGIKFKEKGMLYEAIASFKKAITLNNKYDSAYIVIGGIYASINKADSAIITLKNAVRAIPSFAGAYLFMGNIYRDYKKDLDGAIVSYLGAFKIDSTNKLTLYGLAWCYNAKEKYAEAIKYGVKALEVDNNYKPAYNEVAHGYRRLKLYNECIEQFKKNLAVSVNEQPLVYSAYCYLELNQKEGALKMYEELKKINPVTAENLKKKIDEKQ